MSEISDFGLIVLAVSATVFAALLGMRIVDRVSVPYAALFLVGAAGLSQLVPSLQDVLSVTQVERLTVVALVIILFDGGLHIGLRRFRASAGPILALGMLGTFVAALTPDDELALVHLDVDVLLDVHTRQFDPDHRVVGTRRRKRGGPSWRITSDRLWLQTSSWCLPRRVASCSCW